MPPQTANFERMNRTSSLFSLIIITAIPYLAG